MSPRGFISTVTRTILVIRNPFWRGPMSCSARSPPRRTWANGGARNCNSTKPYGTAFRAPNFAELSDPRFQDIKPEEITGYELVYEQELGRHLRSSLSGFYNQMRHLIVFDSGNYTNFNADTKGLELALEGFWPSGIRGRASYSFQDTRNTSVAWQMPDSPNHMVKLNLSVPLVHEKIFAGVEFQLASNRRTLHNTTAPSG